MDMEKKCEARVRAAKRGKVDRPAVDSKKIDNLNHEIKKLSSALAASKKRAEKAEGEIAILQNAASSTLTKNNDDDVAVVEKLRARAKRAERKLNDMEDEHQSELDDLNAELKKFKAECRKAKKLATEPSTSNALSPSRIPKLSTGTNALERRLEVAKNESWSWRRKIKC